ncbi:MAG TPA: cobalamin-dependent protein [Verrucomicrobiae bacterium]|nr:cobalamin-dependent protein [Verrucomicrobiae bacterium]
MPVKILIAKLGLDAHWRGAVMVARYLRDKGMEVIFIGNQTPEAIAETALQEDVDILGLSSSSGNHMLLAPRAIQQLDARGLGKLPVVLGGTIPSEDYEFLANIGIKQVFGPGISLEEIAENIFSLAHQ